MFTKIDLPLWNPNQVTMIIFFLCVKRNIYLQNRLCNRFYYDNNYDDKDKENFVTARKSFMAFLEVELIKRYFSFNIKHVFCKFCKIVEAKDCCGA